MNFPATPSLTPPPPTFLSPRLGLYHPHQNSAFLQTSLFPTPQLPVAMPPHLPTGMHTNSHHQTTHPASLQPSHSLVSIDNIRPNPLSLSSTPQRSLGTSESYLVPPLLLGSQILAPPSLMSGITSLVGQRAFPSMLLPADHRAYQPNPYTVPLVEPAHKEPAYPAHKTPSLGPTTNTTAAPVRSSLNPTASAPYVLASQDTAAVKSSDSSPQKVQVENRLLQDSAYLLAQSSRPTSSESGTELVVAESEGDESSNGKCSKQDAASLLAAQSLPDNEDGESNDSYSWGRKKRRRRKRKRQEYPSSSDSESEGSCSSSQSRRSGNRRTRNASSHSSATCSNSSRRNQGNDTKNGKKCSSIIADKLSCVPPLLRVSAAELIDNPLEGCTGMDLVSECDVIVSTNSSFSQNKAHPNECPPCPDLEPLSPEPTEVGTTSRNCVKSESKVKPPPQELHSWTEAIIEKSMSRLKQKFGELCPTYNSHGSYSHPTKPPHPILLA